jgi:hypothetical protein
MSDTRKFAKEVRSTELATLVVGHDITQFERENPELRSGKPSD